MDSIAIGNRQLASAEAPGKGQMKAGPVSGFSDALHKAVNDVNSLHQHADQAILNVQAGNTGSLHEAMIALEKADVSFRTMLTVRNKLLEANQEIMRMQV
jgi:flagellar hook-basal body complex protein FliE